MITIVWGPSGFKVIDMLPKGTKFNSNYYITHILTPLCEILKSTEEKNPFRNYVLHADNAKPHVGKLVIEFCESCKLRRAPQPPYSPDIAPSDFFLFGYTKDKLKGLTFASENDLFEEIKNILSKISIDTLHSVFHEWLRRLQKVIDSGGDYIH
jgi:histone-lysine N-methyltransferase SETMAR